jgi:hypothetical protein
MTAGETNEYTALGGGVTSQSTQHGITIGEAVTDGGPSRAGERLRLRMKLDMAGAPGTTYPILVDPAVSLQDAEIAFDQLDGNPQGSIISGGTNNTFRFVGRTDELYRTLAADVTISSGSSGTPTTLVDSGLSVTLGAGETWEFRDSMLFYDADLLGDLKIGLTGPGSGMALRVLFDGLASGATGAQSSVNKGLVTTNGGAAQLGGLGAGTIVPVTITGRIKMGTAAGPVRIQFAQVTSNAVDTRLVGGPVGSVIRMRRVG